MDSDLQARIQLGRCASEVLAQYEALGILPAISDGRREIVIALSGERCGDVFRRVEEVGGRANVVTGNPEALTVIAFTPDSDLFIDAAPPVPVGPESEFGLLVAFLREQGGPTRVNLEEPALNAEIVEPHNQERVPA